MRKDKMGKLFDKRSVSEIVIVVILVAFVVSIGAMILAWSQTYIDTSKQSTDKLSYEEITCGADVSFGIWSREGNSMICLNSTTDQVYVYLDNKGIPINSFWIRLSSLTNTSTFVYPVSLNKMDIKMLKINYSSIPDFSDMVILPIIVDQTNQKQRICKNNVVTVSKSSIPSCKYNFAFLS